MELMEFNEFKKEFQKHFNTMVKTKEKLFLTDVDNNVMWEKYLESFPEGTNLIYKEKREFDCNCCKHFIRHYGNIVSIKDGKLVSIWDIKDLKTPFKEVSEAMSKFVKTNTIQNVFVTTFAKLGTDKNRQLCEDGKVLTWDHFYYELPDHYVYSGKYSIESVQGQCRDSKNVFQRSMEELTLEAGNIILELIDQNSLYRGEEHKKAVETFISYKKKYEKLSEKEKDNWCWQNSSDNPIARIRNSALGTLLIDLSAEDADVDKAVTKFEKVMAPSNYKRPNAVFSNKQKEDAKNKVDELGFTNSLARCFAQLEDITVNNVLFVNRDAKKKLKNVSPFDDLKEENKINPKRFDKVEEVKIEDFMKNILPTTTSIELMVENKHIGNFMSLIAPKDKDAPTMFKWNNNFCWAYNGDIADSMKQRVKEAGGNVEGVLRFSIQWNTDEYNPNDFDAHCIEPNRNEIYFRDPCNLSTRGNLDVDIRNPVKGKPAVENITWPIKAKILEGNYKFFVHNWQHRGGRTGFSAEIEYEGQIYSYEYSKELKQGEKIVVAEINFSKKDGIKFISSLDSSVSSQDIWGIETNKFSKVEVLMFSPNYWDDQDKIGNKHYFFFLENCINETTPRGFFNEFLNEQLTPHRKVFEALGSRLRVEDCDHQLSGIGFSSTQRNSILAKIDGSISRVIKLVF